MMSDKPKSVVMLLLAFAFLGLGAFGVNMVLEFVGDVDAGRTPLTTDTQLLLMLLMLPIGLFFLYCACMLAMGKKPSAVIVNGGFIGFVALSVIMMFQSDIIIRSFMEQHQYMVCDSRAMAKLQELVWCKQNVME